MHSTRDRLWFYLILQRMSASQAIILAIKENRPAHLTLLAHTSQPSQRRLTCSPH